MLIRYADWKRPTDEAYAFRLRAHTAAERAPGVISDIRAVAAEVLADGEAERFAEKIARWTGPEDEVGGARPYASAQLRFLEAGGRGRLSRGDLEAALSGTVLVLRAPSGQTDYVLRDHHTLDVALYHYATTGELPTKLFHADRHSDWCRDGFLDARRPDQAATWWALLEGLKRPDGRPVLKESDVVFATAQAKRTEAMSGRDVGASTRIPGCVDPDHVAWERALEVDGATACDWVSLDLDYFQPASQLALTSGLLRDARFAALHARAKVRLFVLSPQFTNGGDCIAPWTIQGSVASSLRLLNLLRRT